MRRQSQAERAAILAANVAARIRHVSMRRNFTCAGRMIYVVLAALRDEERKPVFDVYWHPDKPERLTLQEIAEFDGGKSWAMAEILKQLRGL